MALKASREALSWPSSQRHSAPMAFSQSEDGEKERQLRYFFDHWHVLVVHEKISRQTRLSVRMTTEVQQRGYSTAAPPEQVSTAC